MSKLYKPRLRSFEKASNQRHITDKDRFLYKKQDHESKYRINIIGAGTIGMEHMYVVTLLGEAQINGIYDQEIHSLDIAEKEYGKYSSRKLFRYNNLKSACEDPNVDALFICTPNYTHLDVLKAAIKSKKPIFLEKPMATTIEDAIKLMNTKGISQIPVVTKEIIKGILSEKELLKPLYEGEYTIKDSVSLVLDSKFITVEDTELISQITEPLLKRETVVVLKNGKPTSLLTHIDILEYISKNGSY